MLLTPARRALLPAAAVLALLWGCAGMKISKDPSGGLQADARAAVAGLVDDYAGRRAPPFFRRFDQDSFPNYETFRNNVRQFMLHVRQIDMDVIVDRALASGSGVGVDAHWNRSYVGQTGGTVVQEGRCSFVFHRGPSGELLVAAIQGQSPF